MEDRATASSFDDLLAWVLEVPPGEARQARMREAARGDPDIEAELLSYVVALEKRPWLEVPERWVIEDNPAPMADCSGMEYGDWRLIRAVGGGGSGEVYEAVRLVQGVPMRGALKLLHRRMEADADRSGFRRELLALTQVEGHPNVIRLLDGDLTEDGECFLVTEFVEGISLEDWATQNGLGVRARVSLFCQVLEALEWVHSKSRVHRDVKPRNLMVCDGRVKLLDFGLAIALGDAMLARAPSGLTVKWASPEQRAASSRGTPASDQYSAALVLRALLTGHEATVAEQDVGLPLASETESLSKKLRRELSGDLDAILAKALAIRPEDRYEPVRNFREDLTRYLRHEPVTAMPGTLRYRLVQFHRREPIASRAIALLAVALVVAGVGWWQTAVNRARAERRALVISGLARQVVDRSLKELENLPGTLVIRDMMVRALENNLSHLATDAQSDGELAVILARAHLHMATVSSAVRGVTEKERGEALRHCGVATQLLENGGGDRRPAAVRELMAEAYSCRADWATVREEVEWRRRAENLRRELAEADRSWQRRKEWADAVRLLGIAEFESGRPSRAVATFERELKLRQQLTAERPLELSVLREMARTESVSGWCSYWLNRYAESTVHLEKASRLYRDLSQKESGSEAELALAKGLEEECKMLRFTGRPVVAAASAQESAAIRGRQARLNPADVNLAVLQAKALTAVSWSLQGTGQLKRAESSVGQAVAVLDHLVNTGRGGIEVARELGAAWSELAAIADTRGDEEEALKRYETSVRWYRQAIGWKGMKYEMVFGLGTALNNIASLKWSLGKDKLVEPPLLALLRDFEGREEADPNADEQKAIAWSILAKGQELANADEQCYRSLGHAVEASRQLLRTDEKSSLFLSRFAERSLALSAALMTDYPAKALVAAREGRDAYAKSSELEPSDFEIAQNRLEAESRVAMLARTVGAGVEADQALVRSRALALSLLQRFGMKASADQLYAIITHAIDSEAEASPLGPGAWGIGIEPVKWWAEWLETEGPKLLGKQAEVVRRRFPGPNKFEKNAKCAPPCTVGK